MLSSSIDAVVVTVAVALVYLLAVHFVDVNEREPVWSVLLAFVLGGASAGALNLGVDRVTLNLGTWQGAALREIALFVALAVTFRILTEIGRLRGWSEITDLVDGLIYGVTAGLGFTCGERIANLQPSLPIAVATTTSIEAVAATALAGLAQGVFGAIVGAGLILAFTRPARFRWLWAVFGLLAAVAVHGAHQVLAYGNALGGAEALWRGRVALALPLLSVVALASYGLATERRVIARELAAEAAAGYVTAPELALLGSFLHRHVRYLRALAGGRVRELRGLAALHNRQVMLALAKRRVDRVADGPARDLAIAEVQALRKGIVAVRRQLGPASSESAGASR